jgi:hypothetical protein
MQYLDDGIPQSLTCCTPIEYPIEVALGTADFISEDLNVSDSFIHAYYRLLNCGFRPGFAAGSDHPCGQVIGPILTYAQVTGGPLTYRGWIEAIANGRTVVSRGGRTQFLDLRVNGTATPGDEVQLAGAGSVQVSARWTASASLARTIELVRNGVVVASKNASAAPGAPDSLTATVSFPASGWLCARVMESGRHEVHTAAVFVSVDGAPVRASVADAQFYIDWIDQLVEKTSPGGAWDSYFVNSLEAAHARYLAARTVFERIASGLTAADPPPIPAGVQLSLVVTPNPTPGPLKVTFTLPVASTAVIDVLDIHGRRAATHRFGPLGPGQHQTTVAAGLAPGIYFVRVTQGSQMRVSRAVVID